MLQKATVPQRIEIDPNTGVMNLVFAKCIVDTDSEELVGSPEPHRVPIEPGQDYTELMSIVNTAIVRDLKAAPITETHLEVVRKYVDFVHDEETVTKYQRFREAQLEKANLGLKTPKA